MAWLGTLLLFAAGIALIVKGGDIFVDAASWMAEKSGIPKFIIGATVVSLATTLPEMLVSFMAAGQGKVDMAIGNAVGSVTANVGLIMGIALVCMPHAVKRSEYMLRSLLMLGAALVLMLFSFTGQIGVVPGVILLVFFAAALWDNVRQARAAMRRPGGAPAGAEENTGGGGAVAVAFLQESGAPARPDSGTLAARADAAAQNPRREMALNLLKFALGAAAIVLGAQLLIDNGSELALLLGVPERIIAVSVIAIGTSLPELVTTISAIAKKQCSLSIGNIIGANIIDLTLILPVCTLISGQALPVSAQAAAVDIPACLAIGCMALLPTLITGKFYRAQGVLLLAGYAVYMVFTTLLIG